MTRSIQSHGRSIGQSARTGPSERPGVSGLQKLPHCHVHDARHQANAESVALDLAAECLEVAVVLDKERLEPSLVEATRPGGMTVGMPSLGVGHGQPAHEPRQVAVAPGPKHEMKVVGHDAEVPSRVKIGF